MGRIAKLDVGDALPVPDGPDYRVAILDDDSRERVLTVHFETREDAHTAREQMLEAIGRSSGGEDHPERGEGLPPPGAATLQGKVADLTERMCLAIRQEESPVVRRRLVEEAQRRIAEIMLEA